MTDGEKWEAIARLLKSGPMSDREVARRLKFSTRRVARVREDLGIPRYWMGCVPAWDQERFDRVAVRIHNGHRVWKGSTGKDGTPVVSSESAYRVAFRLFYGREAVGRIKGTCTRKYCVEGAHLQDRVMRERARGDVEMPAELPGGVTYRGMDLVAIRRALRGPEPYPPLREDERPFAARFADPETTNEELARRLGCCPQSAKRWREAAACG